MAEAQPQTVTCADVEAVFMQAADAMRELPLYHQPLSVELVGWHELSEQAGLMAGILVTPWCMNLLVAGLPVGNIGDVWLLEIGESKFELTRAHHDQIGHYATGSLISMMQQFDTMDTALAFANEALALIQQPAAKAPFDGPTSSKQEQQLEVARKAPEEKGAEPKQLSRRGLFRALAGR